MKIIQLEYLKHCYVLQGGWREGKKMMGWDGSHLKLGFSEQWNLT